MIAGDLTAPYYDCIRSKLAKFMRAHSVAMTIAVSILDNWNSYASYAVHVEHGSARFSRRVRPAGVHIPQYHDKVDKNSLKYSLSHMT